MNLSTDKSVKIHYGRMVLVNLLRPINCSILKMISSKTHKHKLNNFKRKESRTEFNVAHTLVRPRDIVSYWHPVRACELDDPALDSFVQACRAVVLDTRKREKRCCA